MAMRERILHRLSLPLPQTLLAALLLSSAVVLVGAADESPPFAPLFNGKNLSGWKPRDEKRVTTWKVATAAALDPKNPKRLIASGAGGSPDAVLVCIPVDQGSDIATSKDFADCEVHVEFMVPKDGNSGVF